MLAGTDLPSSSRALVLVGSAARAMHPRRPVQRVASFVTQLIANASRVPQTREKRRAEPAEVMLAVLARGTFDGHLDRKEPLVGGPALGLDGRAVRRGPAVQHATPLHAAAVACAAAGCGRLMGA